MFNKYLKKNFFLIFIIKCRIEAIETLKNDYDNKMEDDYNNQNIEISAVEV